MSGANPARPGFARQQRLLKASEFDAVYARRRRVADGCFTVNFLPNELGRARLGLSIGAKAVGNSVARNRVKRVVRESFRQVAAELAGMDLVVGARNGAKTAHNARLRESGRAVETDPKIMRRFLIALIRGYQLIISPHFGQCCRFHPSCSCYAQQAIARHGALKGVVLSSRRILRCHPFNEGGIDPVP